MPDELHCAECGCIIKEEEEGHDTEELGILCAQCYIDNFEVCAECGTEQSLDDLYDYHNTLLCGDCYNDHFHECSCCGGNYDEQEEDAWGGMCESCASEHFICEGCEETCSNEAYSRHGLCEDCYRRHGIIKEYHSGSSAGTIFYPNDKESLYFGVELETDRYPDWETKRKAGKELHAFSQEEELFWLEEDSSLGQGIEIITQPCTLSYHKKTFPWEEISRIVRKHGGKSHSAGTCGLHIHFSRFFFKGDSSDLYQVRLIYLFEKFWAELIMFSRRTQEQWRNTAAKYNTALHDTTPKKKISQLRGRCNRCVAVNITKGTTIEIRIFRGSLDVKTILASIELVDFLVRLVKGTSTKKLQSMTWKDLVELIKKRPYHYLMPYIIEQGLTEALVKESEREGLLERDSTNRTTRNEESPSSQGRPLRRRSVPREGNMDDLFA